MARFVEAEIWDRNEGEIHGGGVGEKSEFTIFWGGLRILICQVLFNMYVYCNQRKFT